MTPIQSNTIKLIQGRNSSHLQQEFVKICHPRLAAADRICRLRPADADSYSIAFNSFSNATTSASTAGRTEHIEASQFVRQQPKARTQQDQPRRHPTPPTMPTPRRQENAVEDETAAAKRPQGLDNHISQDTRQLSICTSASLY